MRALNICMTAEIVYNKNMKNNYLNESNSNEILLAEKLEKMVSKGSSNFHGKDLLEMHFLVQSGYDPFVLNAAIVNTFHAKKTPLNQKIYLIKEQINHSDYMLSYEKDIGKSEWSDISFDLCLESIEKLFNDICLNDPLILKNIQITAVRHGQDETDKLGGWSENHLTEEGIDQVRELTRQLSHEYDLILSSDLNRTKESAEIIQEKLNIPIVYEKQLRETNNGILKNLTKKEAFDQYPGLYYSALKMDERYPKGESPNEFYARVRKAFFDIINKYQGKSLLLVTHGGVITVIQCLVNGWPYSNLLKIAPPTAGLVHFTGFSEKLK